MLFSGPHVGLYSLPPSAPIRNNGIKVATTNVIADTNAIFLPNLASADAINFGSIEGIVKKISPAATQDDNGNTYYIVEIETQKTYFEYNQQRYNLTPGVEVSASILTGERTIAEYLLNPLINISNKAFRER